MREELIVLNSLKIKVSLCCLVKTDGGMKA
jgi:hypothetical protein